MNKRFILSAIVLLVSLKGFSQDPFFVNAQQSLIYLNPSFAGSNGGVRNQFSYRNQWPNLSGTYVTFLNNFDAYIKPIKGGISVTAMHDDQAHGTYMSNTLGVGYAQHLSLMDGQMKIIPSVQVCYFERLLDASKLTFGQSINPRRGYSWTSGPIPNSKKQNVSFNSGLLVNYKHFYIGASAFNINQPDEGLLGTSKLPYRLSFHSSYNWHLSEKIIFNFFARFQQQQKFQLFQFSANALLYKHLILGMGYIEPNVAVANIGYRHEYFVAQFNYDISTSALSNSASASWEVLLSFNLRNKENRKAVTDFEKW